MTRRGLLGLAGAATLRGWAGDSLGAAHDLLYQALECLSEKASADQVGRAVRFLRSALDQYPSFGDAYYFRALCLKRLGRDPSGDLTKAREYQSEALRDSRDPFKLAVPKLYDSLPKVAEKWALVVGVSRFNPDNGAESLRFAEADASAFAELLHDPAIGRFPAANVRLLTNEKATTAAIKAGLNHIATRAKPEDLVVAYIATHGSPREQDLRSVSYLMTYDTDVGSRDQVFGSALAMVDLSGVISTRCVAQRTVVILDTCHSGSGSAGQAMSTQDLDRLREGAGRYIISSCGADQKSYEGDGHGYFTASLMAGLRARKGCIRMQDLFTQVQTDVNKVTAGKQRPVLAKSDSAAEIILGVETGGASEGCLG